MNHLLKTDPEPFRDVKEGKKTFEIRYNDRSFQVGDTLTLRETVFTGHQMACGPHIFPLRYSGQEITVEVTHILHGPTFGLAPGWCVMSIR